METTHNSVKVKLGIKVMKLVESLIGREVTVGQGSECHLTFVRGLLHIAQQEPRSVVLLVVKVKVEILTVNELWSRFL